MRFLQFEEKFLLKKDHMTSLSLHQRAREHSVMAKLRRSKRRVSWKIEEPSNARAEVDKVPKPTIKVELAPPKKRDFMTELRRITHSNGAVEPWLTGPESKETPKGEMIGEKIALTWPPDKKAYPCWVFGYPADENENLHKVVYDSPDNHVEYVDLKLREWDFADKMQIESGSLVGKTIMLSVKNMTNSENFRGIKDKKNPTQDVETIVALVLDQYLAETPEDEVTTVTKLIDVRSEILSTEDLTRIPYKVVDAQSHEPIAYVNEISDKDDDEDSVEEEKVEILAGRRKRKRK